MRLATLLGPDLHEALATGPEVLRDALDEFHPEDIAELLADLPKGDAVALMRALPDDFAAGVLERLDPEQQVDLLRALGIESSVPMIAEMAPDDRVDLVQELPSELAASILDHLQKQEPEVAVETRELGAMDESSAGGLMTPELAALPPETKVWQAIEEVRRMSREGTAEVVYYVYVTAFGGQLVGVVSLRDLILADPGQTLADVMTENVLTVKISDHQEDVAKLMAKYDLSVVPVVDEHNVLRGVVTHDDVMDVIVEEATEDAQRIGGVVPLEDSYFQTRFAELVWKRAVWLVILFMGQLLTATVMEQHQAMLVTFAGLVVFVPLIISTGGNSGSQSSALIIRALAVGEVAPKDWWRVLVREAAMGMVIGLVLAAAGFVRAWFAEDRPSLHLAVTVSASIVAVATLGTTLGCLLPMVIKRVGLDPALSSTPFIASLVDVLGLVVYFALAQAVFAMAF